MDSLSGKAKTAYEQSERIVELKSGEFNEWVGYAPVFKSDANPGVDIENFMANVRFPGYGETGRLMGMFIQHKMIESAGEAACEAPFYSRKLWDDRGSFMSAPSIRSLADIAMTIAAAAVFGPGVACLCMNLVDDVVFTAMDISNGLDAGDALQGLAKKGLVSAASMFAVGNVAGLGSGVISKTVLKGVEVMSNNVLSSAINSLDFEAMFKGRDFFDERGFNKGAFGEGAMAGVVAGMAGQFVSGTINESNLGQNATKVTGFNSGQIGEISSIGSFAGSMVGAGVTYGMTGNATFNVASIRGTGFMELHLGKDGFGMNFGMNGTDVSFSTINGVMNGFKHLEMNRNIEDAAWRNNMDVATALRSQYGFGDQAALKQLDQIISRETLLAGSGSLPAGARGQTVTENGQRVVYLAGYREGMSTEEQMSMGITLQHEAYRDGVTTADNSDETQMATYAHTLMTERMMNDPRYASLMGDLVSRDANLAKDLVMLNKAREKKNLGEFASYVDKTYDSSGDYWKLMEDGTLEYDGSMNLDLTELGGGVLEATESSHSANIAKWFGLEGEEGIVQAKALLGGAWDKVSNGYVVGNAVSLGSGLFDSVSKMFGVCQYLNTTTQYYTGAVNEYIARADKENVDKLNTTVLSKKTDNSSLVSVKNELGHEVFLHAIDENNPILPELKKQDDPAYASIPAIKKSGCNFLGSIAYPQMAVGQVLQDQQVLGIFNTAKELDDPFMPSRKVLTPEGVVNNPDVLTKLVLVKLGRADIAFSFGSIPRGITNYELVGYRLEVPYKDGSHFIAGGLKKTPVYNSGNTWEKKLNDSVGVFTYAY